MIDYQSRDYGSEEVNEIIRLKPEERVQDCGNDLDNKINGILLGAIKVAEARGGHIDIITLRYGAQEIKELLKEKQNN